jgi:entericidin B
MEPDMKKLMILLTAVSFALMGCNTVQGVGKDIEKGGAAIEKAAK